MDSPGHGWTYESAHGLYRKAGWSGVLPLPAGQKTPPPRGWTGWESPDPSAADSHTWATESPTVGGVDYRGTSQLALRMPATVVGLDVDHYGVKHGKDTMAEAERRWGVLPLGPHSSARGDGPSAIWFFQVPRGAALRTLIKFPELGLGHVEVIQRHHRYAVAWPSTHPDTGQQYRWYGKPEAAPVGEDGIWIPNVADLPDLPAAWLEALAGADEPGVTAVDPVTVAEFAKRFAGGADVGAIRGVLATWERDLATDSRHDAMVTATCFAAREARMGRFPASVVRGQLREAFAAALSTPGAGQRAPSPQEVRREFDSMWAWAVSQALAMTNEDMAQRRQKVDTAIAQAEAARPSQHDFWLDEGEVPRPPGAAPVAELDGGGAQEQLGEDGLTDEEREAEQAAQFHMDVTARAYSLRVTGAARDLIADELRGEFVSLDWDAFLDAPLPDYLVPKLLYRNGTAKVFGPPGSTKSFFVLDLALSLATATEWRGRTFPQSRVHYVMAEGQSINTSRTQAWLHLRGVDRSTARGWFHAIPQGVLLTEPGIAQYLVKVRAEQPDLIILDTKARMMVGDENLAADGAVMIRAVDMIREAAGGACVLLVDHTGVHNTTRSRGSNVVLAAMDTEIRVDYENGVAAAEVTRNKDGSEGYRVNYRLQAVPELARTDHEPPAVVVPCEAQEAVTLDAADRWNQDLPALPSDVLEYRGVGDRAIRPLSRFMRHQATAGIGVSRLEARKAVQACYAELSETTIHRAWAVLVTDLKRLAPDAKQGDTGRHQWDTKDGDPVLSESMQ